jgi:hypothetical protein
MKTYNNNVLNFDWLKKNDCTNIIGYYSICKSFDWNGIDWLQKLNGNVTHLIDYKIKSALMLVFFMLIEETCLFFSTVKYCSSIIIYLLFKGKCRVVQGYNRHYRHKRYIIEPLLKLKNLIVFKSKDNVKWFIESTLFYHIYKILFNINWNKWNWIFDISDWSRLGFERWTIGKCFIICLAIIL